MSKPRPAKFAGAQELKDNVGATYWIATDSAGRRFRAPTRDEATQMLVEYNKPARPAKEHARERDHD